MNIRQYRVMTSYEQEEEKNSRAKERTYISYLSISEKTKKMNVSNVMTFFFLVFLRHNGIYRFTRLEDVSVYHYTKRTSM